MFLDDIVDDNVLPYLSLAVDGLTASADDTASLQIRPEDVAANDPQEPQPAKIPDTKLGAEQLEVYGWESSIWRKIKGYIGF